MGNKENKKPLTSEEETLMLVRKLWLAEKWRRFWAILKYTVFIGFILGAFYFLNPYIEKYTGLFENFGDINNPQELQKLLQQLQK